MLTETIAVQSLEKIAKELHRTNELLERMLAADAKEKDVINRTTVQKYMERRSKENDG